MAAVGRHCIPHDSIELGVRAHRGEEERPMPQREERVAQHLGVLERDGTLVIPSSQTRLILKLIVFSVFTAISAAIILTAPATSGNSAAPLVLLTIGLALTALFLLASVATYRQLTQRIRLVLTFQGMRLENENGNIIEQVEWRDIEHFRAIHSRAGTIAAIYYYLTDTGRERRRDFLATDPIGRNQFLVLKVSWAGKSKSVALPSGFAISNADLIELLEKARHRYR